MASFVGNSSSIAPISLNSSERSSTLEPEHHSKPRGIGAFTNYLISNSYFGHSSLNCESGSINRIILKDRNEFNPTMIDHSYSKLWSSSLLSKTLPTRNVFFNYPIRQRDNPNQEDEVLDVDNTMAKPLLTYDAMKLKMAMNECDRYVASTLPIVGTDENDAHSNDSERDDWDERISKTSWTYSQLRLFTRASRILHSDRLGRLTHEGAFNEQVLRRIVIDKSAKRLRQLLASINWNPRLTQWLHTIFMDHLSASYLSAYLDILQVLKSKIPSLVDNMMAIPPPGKPINSSGSNTSSANDSLAQLLKRPWDPTSAIYTQKLKKLPSSPLIVIAPFGPSPSAVNQLRRMRFFNTQFASLGKIVPVAMHSVNGGRNQLISECLEGMMGATRLKVSELRASFPSRPIVLIGWSIGALVACHVALIERIAAVICLGFPSHGIAGPRGELDDPILELRSPTLFVLGQMSPLSIIDDVEDMREKMKIETGLVVVGGADELLRVSHKKKRFEGVTQSMVDRHVLEEVNVFLTNILSGLMPESHDMVSGRGFLSSTTAFAEYNATEIVKEPSKAGRKRKSNLELDNQGDVKTSSIQWKHRTPPSEDKKGFQHLGFFSNSDSSIGVQQSPLLSSQTSSHLETGLKIIGKRSSSLRASAVVKRQKYNTIPMPIESSSTTSDSSNNSIPATNSALAAAVTAASASWDNASNAQVEPIPTPEIPSSVGMFQSMSSSSGGITVNIGALSSLGHLRTTVSTSSSKSPSMTPMTSLVNRLSPMKSPPKLIPTVPAETDIALPGPPPPPSSLPVPTITVQSGSQRSVPSLAKSLPITIHNVPVRSAFSVPRTGTSGSSTFSTLMTYALGSKVTAGASTSMTTTTATAPATSLLFTNKAGALETIRQAGRLIVCKSSDATNRERFLDQVQAIQKMQFHDFPLTTTSLTRSPGTPIITQAKILTSRGLDLKKLQTLSSSIAGQLSASGISTTSTASTTPISSTSSLPSLLIATGGGGKPLFVSGSAATLAKMYQSVNVAETLSSASASSIDSTASVSTGLSTLATQSLLERAKRANPKLNFTVSSLKLHLPERRAAAATTTTTTNTTTSTESSSSTLVAPKLSLLMLSSNSLTIPKEPEIENLSQEIENQQSVVPPVEEQVQDVNEDAALLLDLARSAPAADAFNCYWQQTPPLAESLPVELPLEIPPETSIAPVEVTDSVNQVEDDNDDTPLPSSPIEKSVQEGADLSAKTITRPETPPLEAERPQTRNESASLPEEASSLLSEIVVDQSIEQLVADSIVALQEVREPRTPPPRTPKETEIIILDSDSDDNPDVVLKEARVKRQEKQEAEKSVEPQVVVKATPVSTKGSSSRSKAIPFPTIAATRTRRVRAPKYMYYEV